MIANGSGKHAHRNEVELPWRWCPPASQSPPPPPPLQSPPPPPLQSPPLSPPLQPPLLSPLQSPPPLLQSPPLSPPLSQLLESLLEQPLSAPLESPHDPSQPLESQLDASQAESEQSTDVFGDVVDELEGVPKTFPRQTSSDVAQPGLSRKSALCSSDENCSPACGSIGHVGAVVAVHDSTESIASA